MVARNRSTSFARSRITRSALPKVNVASSASFPMPCEMPSKSTRRGRYNCAPDGAAPVGEIDGGVAALERLDLDERNHLLHLRQQSVLECLRREPGHRRGERVGGVRSRDLDQRHAEAAGVVREHLPGQRLVGEPAGVGGGAVAVVVGRVVGERAVGTVLRLPEVAERAPVGVAQQGAPHGEALRARAQQEALLDLGVAAPELVDRHVRMAGPPERVVRNDGERAGGDDVRNRDVADLVGHGF